MNEEYIVPKVWQEDNQAEGGFANINRPISGSTHTEELPQGKHDLQLYSLATPNGVKVTIMLEELIELGYENAEYDAYPIDITKGKQFSSGFVEVNPNSKIPALVDKSTPEPTKLFESGSILLYLADKFNAFLPQEHHSKTNTLNWLFWQIGSGPYVGGGFGHFFRYAPVKIKYCIDRFTMETKRQLDVLDKKLAKTKYLACEEYTIADIATWPWYGSLLQNKVYEDAAEFLDAKSYPYVLEWAESISQRPAVQRGIIVNRTWGDGQQLAERHSQEDFKKIQD